jgi:hypothetical protein
MARLFPPVATRSPLGDWQEALGDFGQGEALWGRWLGREAEFYRECARLAEGLSWARLLEIGGSELRAYYQVAAHHQAQLLDESMPPELQVGAMRMVAAGQSTCQFWTYSNLDALELPTRLIDVLHFFDGSRSTEEALREVYAETGVRLEPDIVRQLADFEVLIPVERLARR